MEQYIKKISNNLNLTFDESKSAFELLMNGKANDEEIYEFLTFLSNSCFLNLSSVTA